jgi:predicted dinucleotide-utilizing enzyme
MKRARSATNRDLTEMTMRTLISMLAPLIFAASAFAAEPAKTADVAQPAQTMHRYLIERTFPSGALEGLDAATKAKVNSNNATVGVRWLQSYANAAKTKTFCVYEGPSEAAVRKAAELNGLPVDSVMEVPVTLLPK